MAHFKKPVPKPVLVPLLFVELCRSFGKWCSNSRSQAIVCTDCYIRRCWVKGPCAESNNRPRLPVRTANFAWTSAMLHVCTNDVRQKSTELSGSLWAVLNCFGLNCWRLAFEVKQCLMDLLIILKPVHMVAVLLVPNGLSVWWPYCL